MSHPFGDLGKPEKVPFSKIFLDPNNPRVAAERENRYEDPDKIFDAELQRKLTTTIYDIYQADDLEAAIVAQGWVPIDPIIVWEHPDRPKHYIVVEGNTRVSVLRSIRAARLEREKAKLAKALKAKAVGDDIKRQQQQLVEQLESIIEDTDKLTVYPVNAATIEELEAKLPRLLGVRHITHARQWTPYATNLYIRSLYERLFRERYGAQVTLRLEQDLITQVASMVSLGETKARRNIQAASAFSHFKLQYEDQLPAGEEFTDSDQYFFELLLQNKYAQEQFGFTKDRLCLPDESEKALFEWAFAKPLKDEDKNPNIFYKAENIRLWNDMSKYDAEHSTGFASQFDVSAPEKTTKPMRLVEAEYLHHKAQQTPLNTLQSLLGALNELKGETMITQANFLRPTLAEIANVVAHYLLMLDADKASSAYSHPAAAE